MIYISSRVKHAELWRAYRDAGWPIISTWINQAGPTPHWLNIQSEIAQCQVLLLYVVENDFPLKGALVEVGMALALNKTVVACAPGVQLEAESLRPLGSWLLHPRVYQEPNPVLAWSYAADIAEGRIEA
jgi:hypothetical protein